MISTKAYRLPNSAIGPLLGAAILRRRYFRPPIDVYWTYLAEHSVWSILYDADGLDFVIACLFLRDVRQIDLLHSDLDGMADSLTKRREATHTFLVDEHRKLYLSALRNVGIEQSKWEEFCLRFFAKEGRERPQVSELRVALGFIVASLEQVDESHSVLVITG